MPEKTKFSCQWPKSSKQSCGDLLTLNDDESIWVCLSLNPGACSQRSLVPIRLTTRTPHWILRKISSDLIVQLCADDTLIAAVALHHEDPIVFPLLSALDQVPPAVLVQPTAPDALDGVVVEDDGETLGGQRFNDGIVDLERRHAPELRIGVQRRVWDSGVGVDHLVGEG